MNSVILYASKSNAALLFLGLGAGLQVVLSSILKLLTHYLPLGKIGLVLCLPLQYTRNVLKQKCDCDCKK